MSNAPPESDRKRSLETEESHLIRDSKRLAIVEDFDWNADASTVFGKTAEEPPAGKKSKSTPKETLVTMRLLVSSNHSGSLIGKSGSTIANIREKSGARVTLSEKIAEALDRIFTAVGTPGQVAEASALVAEILAQCEDADGDPLARKLTMRFLIPNELMGAIIGKQAAKVKEIRQISKARISATEGLLPECTERKLAIIGNMEEIRVAVLLVRFCSFSC